MPTRQININNLPLNLPRTVSSQSIIPLVTLKNNLFLPNKIKFMLYTRNFHPWRGSNRKVHNLLNGKTMIGFRTITLLLLTSVSSFCGAQAVSTATVRQGSPVALAFTAPLSSATAAVGDKVSLVLAGNLQVDGVTLVKAGTTLSGQVTLVKRAAMAGRSGQINIRLDDLVARDMRIKLTGSKNKADKPDLQFSTPYHLKWPLGLLRTGDNVEINGGTLLTVFVAEEITLPLPHEKIAE